MNLRVVVDSVDAVHRGRGLADRVQVEVLDRLAHRARAEAALRFELEEAADEVLDRRVGHRERGRGDHVDVLALLVRVLHQRVAEHVRVAALGEHDLVLVARELRGSELDVIDVALVGLVPVRKREAIERARVPRVHDDVAIRERAEHVALELLAAGIGLRIRAGSRARIEDPDLHLHVVAVRVDRPGQRAARARVVVPGRDRRAKAAVAEPLVERLRVDEVRLLGVVVVAEVHVDGELAVLEQTRVVPPTVGDLLLLTHAERQRLLLRGGHGGRVPGVPWRFPVPLLVVLHLVVRGLADLDRELAVRVER